MESWLAQHQKVRRRIRRVFDEFADEFVGCPTNSPTNFADAGKFADELSGGRRISSKFNEFRRFGQNLHGEPFQKSEIAENQ